MMQAKLIRDNIKGAPGSEDVDYPMYGFTLGKSYDVFGIYQVRGECYFLLVSDSNRFANRTSYCFQLETMDIPNDWKINVIQEEMLIVIGPDFISESYRSLAEMVNYESVARENFFSYVNRERT